MARSGRYSRSISAVIPPGRKSVGTSPARSSTVDSTPTPHGPPSRMSGMRPSISSKTCAAVVGLGLPLRFALGAAMGRPSARISILAAGCDGMRTATVESPALTASGISSDFGKTIVSGPGQNASISFCARSSTRATSGGSSLLSLICAMSGLSAGRPFASKIFSTALPLSASAPSP